MFRFRPGPRGGECGAVAHVARWRTEAFDVCIPRSWGGADAVSCAQLMHIVPGQQLFYYGSRVWPDGVRKQMYDQFGGMPKDLSPAHDYDPKVGCAAARDRASPPPRGQTRRQSVPHGAERLGCDLGWDTEARARGNVSCLHLSGTGPGVLSVCM